MTTTQPGWYTAPKSTYVVRDNLLHDHIHIAVHSNDGGHRFMIIKKFDQRFSITSSISHSAGCTDICERMLSAHELRLMFGIPQTSLTQPPHEAHISDTFVRSDVFVSFPSPRNGGKFDPTIQFEINPAITRAVQEILDRP